MTNIIEPVGDPMVPLFFRLRQLYYECIRAGKTPTCVKLTREDECEIVRGNTSELSQPLQDLVLLQGPRALFSTIYGAPIQWDSDQTDILWSGKPAQKVEITVPTPRKRRGRTTRVSLR